MVLNPINTSRRVITLFCTLTSIYLPLYLLFLFYNDSIYQIGNINYISLILLIIAAELIKFSLTLFFTDISFGSKDSKGSKIKKNLLKLKLKEIFKCSYLLISSTAVFYILAVLFGAPVVSDCEQTLMFGMLMTSLAILPSCLHLGADNTVAMLTGVKLSSNVISDLLLKNMRLTLLGAWVGAVVIPLDWDRPWQVWPIPCCTGAMIGYTTSHVLELVKSIPVPSIFAKVNVK